MTDLPDQVSPDGPVPDGADVERGDVERGEDSTEEELDRPAFTQEDGGMDVSPPG